METLTRRPAFRGLVRHTRALVPAWGDYQWQGERRQKTPYHIHPQEERYLALAGLYEVWQRPNGEALYRPSSKFP